MMEWASTVAGETAATSPGASRCDLCQVTTVYFLILDPYFEDTVQHGKRRLNPPCRLILCSVRILFEVSINYVAHCNVIGHRAQWIKINVYAAFGRESWRVARFQSGYCSRCENREAGRFKGNRLDHFSTCGEASWCVVCMPDLVLDVAVSGGLCETSVVLHDIQ